MTSVHHFVNEEVVCLDHSSPLISGSTQNAQLLQTAALESGNGRGQVPRHHAGITWGLINKHEVGLR